MRARYLLLLVLLVAAAGCNVDMYKDSALFTVANFNRTDPGRNLIPMVNGSDLRTERFEVLPPGRMDRYRFELPVNNQCQYTTGFEPRYPCTARLSLAFRDATTSEISTVCETQVYDNEIANFEVYNETYWDVRSGTNKTHMVCRQVI